MYTFPGFYPLLFLLFSPIPLRSYNIYSIVYIHHFCVDLFQIHFRANFSPKLQKCISKWLLELSILVCFEPWELKLCNSKLIINFPEVDTPFLFFKKYCKFPEYLKLVLSKSSLNSFNPQIKTCSKVPLSIFTEFPMSWDNMLRFYFLYFFHLLLYYVWSFFKLFRGFMLGCGKGGTVTCRVKRGETRFFFFLKKWAVYQKEQ